MTGLEHAILKTVAWFSFFEVPVTVFEMWKWMLEPERAYSLDEVYEALATGSIRDRLVSKDGLWTLLGSESLANGTERRARFLDAVRKRAKLRRAAQYLSAVPGVECVATGNTLAWWNTRPESDIDLFLVTRPGMVWFVRLFAVAPFAALGKRPGASEIDPFCFSFFLSSDALDLSGLTLPGGDPYLAYWIRSLALVSDRNGTFGRFQSENAWAAASLPHAGSVIRAEGAAPVSKNGWWARTLEWAAKRAQMRRLPMRIRRVMNADTCVVVTDQVLKFHENDRREEYRERLRRICSSSASPTSSSCS